jgi:hypothetical protein
LKKLATGTDEDTQERLKKAAVELSGGFKDLLSESKNLFKDVENPMLVDKVYLLPTFYPLSFLPSANF